MAGLRRMKGIIFRTGFLKDWKKLEKKHYKKQELLDVIQILCGNHIPAKYHDHALSGNYKGYRECHIRPNWLLVYKSTETEITSIATGTHDDLFK